MQAEQQSRKTNEKSHRVKHILRRATVRRPTHFVAPALVPLAVIAFVPLVYAVYIALHSINVLMPYLGRPFVGVHNFVRVFIEPRSLLAFARTFILVGITVVPELVFGLLLSWAILRGTNPVERSFISVLLVFPMAIPRVAAGLIWRVLYDPLVGPINYVLSLLGGPSVGWLADPHIAIVSIAIVDIWQWTPFMLLVLLAGMEGIPQEMFEAASLDGATHWRIFRRIVIPLLRPFITIAVIFRVLDAMRTFDYVFTLTQGGPGRATETVDVFAYAIGISETGDISFATASALVLLVLTIGLATVYTRIMKWGERI